MRSDLLSLRPLHITAPLSHIMEEEYIHKWENTTEDLYSKIDPISGILYSKISNGFKSRNWIDNIWVEFKMNDFTYTDPFYGEINVNNNFKAFFELFDIVSKLKFESILDIQKLEFNAEDDYINGSFSNSLDMLVTNFKFGEINDWHIDIEVTFSLANSDSYGCMTGTVKDHLTKSGTIKTKLKIRELELGCRNEKDPFEDAKHLNWKIYNPEKIRLATDLNWSADHSKGYYIPFRSIEDRLNIKEEYPFQSSKSEGTKSEKWKFWK